MFFNIKKNIFYRFFEILRIENTNCNRYLLIEIKRDSTKILTTILDIKLQVIVSTLQILANNINLNLKLFY